MIDGKYSITMDIPAGIQKGTLELRTRGNIVDVNIDIMGTRKTLSGTTDGSRFEFSGTVRKMLIKLTFDVSGSVSGNILTASAKSNLGDFTVNGVRL